jgi:histidinol-phosphate aminotransferase
VVELRRAVPDAAIGPDAVHGAIDLDAVQASIHHSTRLVFLASPNNPTGDGIDAGALCRFLDRVPPGVVVVLDEAYRDYSAPGDAALADGPALVAAGRRLIVVRSFSKLLGLAGLRVGYGFGPDDLIGRLDAGRPTYNVNAVAQAAALAALADTAHTDAVRDATRDGRAALAAGLAALGCAVLPSHANFVLARPPAGADAGALADALAGRGVLVKPGRAFGLPGHLRIGVGRPQDHRRLFSALTEVLADLAPPAGAGTQGS